MADEVSSIGVRLTLDASGFTNPMQEATGALNTFQKQAARAASGVGQTRAGGGAAKSTAASPAAQNLTGVNVSLVITPQSLTKLRSEVIRGLGVIPVTITPQFAATGKWSIQNVMGSMLSMQYGITQTRGSQLSKKAIEEALGPMPKKAHGGPVQAGRPIVVGERRAEVFVPQSHGRVESNAREYIRQQEHSRRFEMELATLEQTAQRRHDQEMRRIRGGGVRGHGGKYGSSKPAPSNTYPQHLTRLWGDPGAADPGYLYHGASYMNEIRGRYNTDRGTGISPRGRAGDPYSYWATNRMVAPLFSGSSGYGGGSGTDVGLVRARPSRQFEESWPGARPGSPAAEERRTSSRVPRSQLQYWGDDNDWHRFRRGRARMAGGPVEPMGPLQRRIAGLAPLEPPRPAPPPEAVFEPEWLRRARERRLPPKVYRQAGGPIHARRGVLEVPARDEISYPGGYNPNTGSVPLSDNDKLYWVASSQARRDAIRQHSGVPGTIGNRMLQEMVGAERTQTRLYRGIHVPADSSLLSQEAGEIVLPISSFDSNRNAALFYARNQRSLQGLSDRARERALKHAFEQDPDTGLTPILMGIEKGARSSHIGSFGGQMDEHAVAGLFRIENNFRMQDFVRAGYGDAYKGSLRQLVLKQIGMLDPSNPENILPMRRMLGGGAKHAGVGARALRSLLKQGPGGGGTYPVDPNVPVPTTGHALGISAYLPGAVSYHVPANDPKAFMRAFRAQQKAGAPFVGTWWDPATDLIDVDPSTVIQDQVGANRVLVGSGPLRKGGEKAAYDLTPTPQDPYGHTWYRTRSRAKVTRDAAGLLEIIAGRRRRQHGGPVFELEGMAGFLKPHVQGTVERLLGQYPMVGEHLTKVQLSRGFPPYAAYESAEGHGPIPATPSMNAQPAASAVPGTLHVSAQSAGSYGAREYYTATGAMRKDKGFHVPGTSSITGNITHEVGHALRRHIEQSYMRYLPPSLQGGSLMGASLQGQGLEGLKLPETAQQLFDLEQILRADPRVLREREPGFENFYGISPYAEQARVMPSFMGGGPFEPFAELFSSLHTPGGKTHTIPDPLIDRMQKMLVSLKLGRRGGGPVHAQHGVKFELEGMRGDLRSRVRDTFEELLDRYPMVGAKQSGPRPRLAPGLPTLGWVGMGPDHPYANYGHPDYDQIPGSRGYGGTHFVPGHITFSEQAFGTTPRGHGGLYLPSKRAWWAKSVHSSDSESLDYFDRKGNLLAGHEVDPFTGVPADRRTQFSPGTATASSIGIHEFGHALDQYIQGSEPVGHTWHEDPSDPGIGHMSSDTVGAKAYDLRQMLTGRPADTISGYSARARLNNPRSYFPRRPNRGDPAEPWAELFAAIETPGATSKHVRPKRMVTSMQEILEELRGRRMGGGPVHAINGRITRLPKPYTFMGHQITADALRPHVKAYREISERASDRELSVFGGNMWYQGRRRSMLQDADARGWLDRSSFSALRRSAEAVLAVPSLASPGVPDAQAVRWSHSILDAITHIKQPLPGMEEAFARALQLEHGLPVGYGYGNFTKAISSGLGRAWPPKFGKSPKVEEFYHATRGRERSLVGDTHHLAAGAFDPNGPAASLSWIVRNKQRVGTRPSLERALMMESSRIVQGEYAHIWPSMRRWQAGIWGEHFPVTGQPIEAAYTNLVVPKLMRPSVPAGWKVGAGGLLTPRAEGGYVESLMGSWEPWMGYQLAQEALAKRKDAKHAQDGTWTRMSKGAHTPFGGDVFHYLPDPTHGIEWRSPSRGIHHPSEVQLSAIDEDRAKAFESGIVLWPNSGDAIRRRVVGTAGNVRLGDVQGQIGIHNHPVAPNTENMIGNWLPTQPPWEISRPSNSDVGALFGGHAREGWTTTPNQTSIMRAPAWIMTKLGGPMAAAAQQMAPQAYLQQAVEAMRDMGMIGQPYARDLLTGMADGTAWRPFLDLINSGRVASNNTIWDRVMSVVGNTTGMEYLRFPADLHRTKGRPKGMELETWKRFPKMMENKVFHMAGGGQADGGLYIVGEVGPELFVPQSMAHLIPKKVMDQIPKAAGGMQVIGQKPNSLFAPPEDGIIIPNRLMDQIPHAIRGADFLRNLAQGFGRSMGATPPQGFPNIEAGPMGAGTTFEPSGAMRGPFGSFVPGRDLSGSSDMPAWERAATQMLLGPGAARPQGTPNRAAPPPVIPMGGTPMPAIGAPPIAGLLDIGMRRATGETIEMGPGTAGPPPPGRTTAGGGGRTERVVRVFVTNWPAGGIGGGGGGGGGTRVRQAGPGMSDADFQGQFGGTPTEEGTAPGPRAHGVMPESEAALFAQRRQELSFAAQAQAARTPRGMSAVLGAQYFGGRDKSLEHIAAQRRALSGLEKATTAVYGSESGGSDFQAYKDRLDDLVLARADERGEIQTSVSAMEEANPKLKDWNEANKEYTKSLNAGTPGLAATARNFAGIMVGVQLYSMAMQGVGVVMAAASPVVERFVDQIFNYQAVATKTTTAMGEQVHEARGNIEAIMAQTAASAGLSASMMDYVANAVTASAMAKAAGVAQAEAVDLFRTTLSTAKGEAPEGLIQGYGGFMGSAFLGEFMGGKKGFSEQIAGGAQTGGPLGQQGNAINTAVSFLSSTPFRNYVLDNAKQQGSPMGGAADLVGGYGDYIRGLPVVGEFWKAIIPDDKTPKAPPGVAPIFGGKTLPPGEMGKVPGLEGVLTPEGLGLVAYFKDLSAASDRGAKAVGRAGAAMYSFTADADDIAKATKAAYEANDPYSMGLAQQGVILRDASGAVIDNGKAHKQALEDMARGRTIIEPKVWAEQNKRELQAQQQANALQTQRGITVELPYEMTKQLLMQPLITPGAAFFPGSAGGKPGVAPSAAGAGLSKGAQGIAQQALGASAATNVQLQGIADQGLKDARAQIEQFLTPADVKTWDAAVGSAQTLSGEIATLSTNMSRLNMEASQASWGNQIRLAKRALGDAIAMQGKAGGERLGYLQREQWLVQRASQKLDLWLQGLQIDFQKSMAGFQAPGLTSEERGARQQMAMTEAKVGETKLGFSWDEFRISGGIWRENVNRAALDASRAIDVMTKARDAEAVAIASQEAIAKKQQLLAHRVGVMDKLMGQATNNYEGALSAAGKGVGEFSGAVSTAVTEIYTVLGYKQNKKTGTWSRSQDPNAPGQAAGYLGAFGKGAVMTVGEAGPETVAILRNPRAYNPMGGGSMSGFGPGGGGTTVNLTINVQGDVKDEATVAKIVRAVEDSFNRKAARIGMRSYVSSTG